jgi:tRNA (mo5U34)-methyltransferase
MHDLIKKRRHNPVRQVLGETGLYHSFRLPDGRFLRGAMSMELQEERLAPFRLAEDLKGKRILDIGPWDGYYTFEMERRGAEVVAIDYADLDTFRELHRALNSQARYLRLDVYELDPAKIGTFDIVLCLGVLYHLKHPLLALEKICAVTRDVCIVDTFVIDGETWQQDIRSPLPYVEFYETDELGGQVDNWSGPTVTAVEALIRAAGFARADVLCVTDTSAAVAAARHWRDLPPTQGEPIEIAGLTCHFHRGRSFQSQKEEYIALWCLWPNVTAPPLDVVFPEVDGFGVAPLACALTKDGLLVNMRVPPGLCAGRHETRLKIGGSRWSKASTFYVNLPPIRGPIHLVSVQDGITWHNDEVVWEQGGWMTLWVQGLSAEADPGNTLVELAGIPHYPEEVYPDSGQINVRLRPVVHEGMSQVRVLHRGAVSNTVSVAVRGQAPAIQGLEPLTAGQFFSPGTDCS